MASFVSRREWLQWLTLGAASTVVGQSCSTLDEVVLGPADDMESRVAIVGGGLAALSYAREIHRRRVPFRIFEQSTRLGGRVWTLQRLTEQGHWAELGGEWFSQTEFDWAAWLKALRLDTQLADPKQTPRMFAKKSWQSEPLSAAMQLRELQRAARAQSSGQWNLGFSMEARRAWETSRGLDVQTSLADWGKGLSRDSQWEKSLDSWALHRYGVGANQISSAVFLRYFLFCPTSELGWQDQNRRIDRGSELMVQALLDHFLGAVPRSRIRLSHELKKIEKVGSRFQLFFQSPEGRRRVQCEQVVLAIPLSQYAKIEGLERLIKWNAPLEALPWARTSQRTVLVNAERFWQRLWGVAPTWGEISAVESETPVGDFALVKSGVLTMTNHGDQARGQLSEWQRRWIRELGEDNLNLRDVRQFDWTERKGFEGRASYLPVSQQPAPQSLERNLELIGEHMSHWNRGTMAGAIETGLQAAAKRV